MSDYSAAVLADSPTLYWPLNEASGAAALDSSAAGTNAGTYAGGFALGEPGGTTREDTAVLLTGTTGWVSRPSSPSPVNNTYTVEAWFRCDDLTQKEQTVVANGSDGDGMAVVVNGNNGTGNLAVLFNQVVWNTVALRLAQGAWYHVAVAVDAAGRPTLYLNGSPVPGSITSSTSRTPTAFSAGGLAKVGAVSRPFKGALGHAALYPATLPAARVAAHYAAAGVPRSWGYHGALPSRPARQVVQPTWARDLLAAYLMRGYDATADRDARGRYDAALGGAAGWGRGELGAELTFAGGDDGRLAPVSALSLVGLSEMTVSFLARGDSWVGGDASLRYLGGQENSSGVSWLVRADTAGKFVLCGGVGLPDVLYPVPPAGLWVLYTARLRPPAFDLFYGGVRVATGTAGAVTLANWPTYFVGNNYGLARSWAGGMAAHYAWGRALTDSEIFALAADPFAPVRPAPARVGLLVPPPPTFDPLPWLRGAAAAPRAARLPPPAASGWAPRLTPAADLLPWLRRAAAPAPPATAPRALLAPWTPASAPAPDPLAWLLRGVPSPPPEAAPLTTLRAGWRPEIGAGPAPPVRHALVRFWRGPEARMPRLEDGEPAWATDTKSLWMGSASGNVRIGP